jgi:NACalpha-BTF3-like transcription factor
MLKTRDVIHDYLDKKCMEIIFNQDKCLELYDYCYLNYNMPKGLTADLVAGRKTFAEVSEFCLFILIEGLDKTYNNQKINFFFTEQEIKTYSKAKYEISNSKFPIEFNVIQVTPAQWIGTIDVQSLMKLRNAQLINYNENAQRALQKIIKGDKEFFKIQINKKAVNDIADSLKSEMYIPDDLTLNIPEEDIEMVANTAGVSPADAEEALRETGGDLAEAILKLNEQ